MKKVDLVIPVKVSDDLKFNVSTSYDEPENFAEVSPTEENFKIYKLGLKSMVRIKTRNENNLAPIAKRLVTMKVFSTLEESINFLLKQKGMK